MPATRKYTKNLPAVKQSYHRWIKLKNHFSSPFNKAEFSLMKGVPISTLTSWDKAMKDEEILKEPGTDDGVIEDETSMFIDRMYQLSMDGKGAKYAELYAKIKGILKGEKEETGKNGFTASDRIKVGCDYRDALYAELRDTGVCPVCHQCKALHDEPRLDTEREHDAGSEVATVAVSS